MTGLMVALLAVAAALGLIGMGLAWWQAAQTSSRLVALTREPPPTARSPWRRGRLALRRVAVIMAVERAELEREGSWRRDLVGSLANPAVLLNAGGRLSASNAAARELLRLPERPGDTTIVQTLGSTALTGAVEEVRRTGRPVQVDATLPGTREVHAVASMVGDETLIVLTDRTRERRIAALRRDFVANASHELKTPATAIQTLSEALDVTIGHDPQRARELVGGLHEEAARLVRLVHDLLDLRRLEDAGPLEREPVDLVELTRLVLADLDQRARNAGVEIALAGAEQAIVVGVREDLRLVVRNLVANAIQYNRRGGHADVSILRRDDAYEITVRDTGIGIRHQDLTRIFERFYRVDPARSRETGGTGLGLSIVRNALARHGGSIAVDSLLGSGSTFRVVIPVEPAP